MKYHILNGQLLPAEEAAIGLNDLALLRGHGVFDFFAVHKGRPLFLEDHLQRFQRSAALYDLDIPCSMSDLRRQIFQLIRACSMEEGGISLVLTGGYAEDGFHADTRPNLLLLSRPPQARFADRQKAHQPVKLLLDSFVRELPEAKGLNYARALRKQKALKALQAAELLYTDGHRVLETFRSNVFLVLPSGKLCTAGTGVLQGITRKYVLQLAREQGLDVQEGDVPLGDLAKAKEVFLTGSGKGLFPVSQIYLPSGFFDLFPEESLSLHSENLAALSIGDGRPGLVWRQLNEAMSDFVEKQTAPAD